MRDPIHDIVQRLALIEGRITPAEPAGDQNSQQKSAHQLPALFKPGKGGPILGGNPDKPAVTKGYFFGAEAEEKEEDLLDMAWGLEATSRLSCQALVGNADLIVEIPKYTINHAKENH